MKYPFNLLTDYFVRENHVDISKEYEIVSVPARTLIKYNRFDLMAKWIYIDAKERGVESDFAERIYFDNINAFSSGSFKEPGTDEKNSFEKYKKGLDALIISIKENGFDETKSLVPVGKNDVLLDGSHRVAVAAYYDQEIKIIRFPKLDRCYDYRLFQKYLMSDISMGYMASYYTKLKKNCYMACIWPRADLKKMYQAEELIRGVGDIVYSQNVFLTRQGMHNFMIQIYGKQSWTGHIENHFKGIENKVEACYSKGKPIRTYLFECDNLEKVIEVKKKIRDIFNVENHSIHISDDSKETEEMVDLLYNPNSVYILNSSRMYMYSGVYTKLLMMKEVIKNRDYDKKRFIIDSSAVLEVCGLREAADIDYLTDYTQKNIFGFDGIDNHESQLKYWPISVKEMLYNPENHFFYEGMKFISPQRLVDMKNIRAEKKDIRDVKLLKKIINRKNKIPKEYDPNVREEIRCYQIENKMYGLGSFSLEQFKSHKKEKMKAKIKTSIIEIVKPLYYFMKKNRE